MAKVKRRKSDTHRTPKACRVWRSIPQPPGETDLDRYMMKNPKLLKQEMFILALSEKILGEMIRQKMKRRELAHRMGRSKAWLDRFLLGQRGYFNVRSISDACHALGVRPVLYFKRMK